MAMNKKER